MSENKPSLQHRETSCHTSPSPCKGRGAYHVDVHAKHTSPKEKPNSLDRAIYSIKNFIIIVNVKLAFLAGPELTNRSVLSTRGTLRKRAGCVILDRNCGRGIVPMLFNNLAFSPSRKGFRQDYCPGRHPSLKGGNLAMPNRFLPWYAVAVFTWVALLNPNAKFHNVPIWLLCSFALGFTLLAMRLMKPPRRRG